jgi:hypothetical protein
LKPVFCSSFVEGIAGNTPSFRLANTSLDAPISALETKKLIAKDGRMRRAEKGRNGQNG